MAIILKVAKYDWRVAMLRKLAILVFSAGLIMSPLSVQALGFGGIKLKSSLNEKLNAEVALLSANQTDITSLKIKLATDEAFLRAGISRTAFLNGINFKVKQYKNGDYYIHLTTEESVREPFLDFLLDINWKNGRMLREYTMLLDPPGRENKQTFAPNPTPAVTEAITPVVPIEAEVVEEPIIPAREVIKPVITKKESAKDLNEAKKAEEIARAIEESFVKAEIAAAKFEPNSAFAEDDSGELWPRISLTDYDESDKKKPIKDVGSLDYGIVKANDNLWKIAEKLRQNNKNVSIYQVMMALLQSNPDAFTDNNIHRLNVGHVLRINDASALTKLTRKESANAYSKQTSAWNQYRKQAAGTAGVQPIIASEVLKTKAKAIDESSGELTLSSPDGKSLVSGGGTNEESLNNDLATMQDQLRQTKADAGTMRNRNTELNEKLQLLEDELNRLQRSISVKDDELAALQHQLSGMNTTTADEPDAVKETVVKATEVIKAEKSPVEPPAEIAATEKEQVSTETDAGIMGIITGMGAAVVGVFAGDSLLVITPLVLFLLIIIGIMIRRKRQGDKFQESILTGTATAETKADTTDDSSSFLEESSFLSDFAMSGAGAIEADDSEVDPLTEADVFIAYGRFEAAEERLNEAVQNEPERLDLRAKMLELHHATKNKDAFEAGAEDFYASLGGNESEEPLWQKIVDLGTEIAPENPLFVQDIVEEEVVTKEQDIAEPDVALMSDSEVMDIGLETGVFEASGLDSSDKMDSDMDFNLDLGDELEAFNIDEPTPEEEDLEFNLELDEEETTSKEVTTETDTTETEDIALDFNLDTTDADSDSVADIDMIATDAEDDMLLDFSLDSAATEKSNEESTLDSDDGNSLDFNIDMDADKPTDEVEIDLELDEELPTADNGLDFNIDETATEENTIEESNDDLDLDFKLDVEADIEETTTEFDLSLAGDNTELETDSPSTEEEISLDEDDDLDLGSSDEVGTKLDLAKAYIDMGDPEGARSILSEVMDEGSDKQKEEAQELLGQIV